MLFRSGVGWLIGGQINSGLHRASRSSAIARPEFQAEPVVEPVAPAGTNQSELAEAERAAALLAKRRATLHTLEAKVLQLDQAGKAREACDALGDLEPMLRGLAPGDFPAVWKWFSQLRSPLVQLRVQHAVLSAWSRVDPRTAFEVVVTLPKTSDWVGGEVWPYKPLDMVLSRWAETEPESALAGASQVPEDLRQGALAIVSNTVAGVGRIEPDPDSALAQAQSLTNATSAPGRSSDPTPRDNAFWNAFEAFVVAGRGTEAAAFVSSLPESAERQKQASDLARAWVGLDLQGATAWVSQLSGDASLCKAAWDGLKERWVKQDPAAAVRFALAAFPAGDERIADFSNIAGRSLSPGFGSNYDDDVAYNLTHLLPAGPERDAVAAALAQRWTDYAPDEAASLVASMRPGAEQTRAAIRTAEQWADWDPVAAAAWAASFPAGGARSEALAGVAQTWAGKDAAAASDWLRTLPADDARARTAEAYVLKAADQHPELAAQWVAFMTNEQKRNQQIEKIGQQWLKKDPAAAQAWLETTRSSSAQTPPESWRSQ